MSGLSRIKWTALVLGIFFLGFGGFSLFKSNQTPIDYYDLTKANVKPGLMVEGDIYCNFGVYEESYSTSYGIKDKSSEVWYYVIPCGEEEYMGLAVSANELGTALDKQTEQSYDYMDGTTNVNPDLVHIKGAVTKMDNEDMGYFKEFLASGGYSDSEIEQLMVPYYITDGSYSQATTFLIIGVVGLAVGIVLILIDKKRA